ncbi:twin-arginine translocation pathway signal protein [Streptomyces piniterrae]|uniref:Twin-arginine translocation pathway signal protein n=1 Tax=Streptomyces piniterrae TaxID=2571125 RepID=A0A4U0MND6_9ACTN|nr:sulfatase-like hydrolase/transferase [Streptomyces piniterrae]TJZ42291.1 twin-arginine translocation pathway signal protein [Streptomyces piniterrae]
MSSVDPARPPRPSTSAAPTAPEKSGESPGESPGASAGSAISRRTFGGLAGGVGAAAAIGGLGTVAGAPSAAAEEPRSQERAFRAAPGRRSRRPNVLFILGDDLGWADLSSYGAPDIRTPHLDRLARQGVRFTQAYAGSATCSPTRFSLYTGRYPGRTEGGLAEPIADKSVGLAPDHPTLASLLRDAGYATALIGKWHCGYLPDYSPTKSGWDTFFGNFGGALEYYSKLGLAGEYDLYEGDAEYQDLRYYTRIITERAVDYLTGRAANAKNAQNAKDGQNARNTAGRRTDHPWLLNLNFTTPHWPWIADGDTEESAKIVRRIKAGERGALWHQDGGSLAKYREMVEDLDRSIGEVLAALKQSGQEEDTLVFFASDNGGERWSYNWPLSGNKASLQEGGIRVPTIVRWPSRLDGGQVSHEPVFTPDWTATLLEIAGARPDRAHPLDGTSLAGYLLRGEPLAERDLFWRVRGERALRRGDWKYYRGKDGRDRLFHVTNDPREQADKAADDQQRLGRLRAAWEAVDRTLLPYPKA